MVLENIMEDIKERGYTDISVKIPKDNPIVRKHLEKFGFVENSIEDEALMMYDDHEIRYNIKHCISKAVTFLLISIFFVFLIKMNYIKHFRISKIH